MNQSYARSRSDVAKLATSGKILSAVLAKTAAQAREGVNLEELDQFADREIMKRGGRPSFKGFKGYPRASCLSLNEAIVHGLPHDRKLASGDVLGIDIGVEFEGWYTDAATTIPIGSINERSQQLIAATKLALEQAIKVIKPGINVGMISATIAAVARASGFGVIKTLSGHGIGRNVHEPPQVPNFGSADRGPRLRRGQVLAIEPMFSTGSGAVRLGNDRWTVECSDGIGSHHEATVLVTRNGARLLTKLV